MKLPLQKTPSLFTLYLFKGPLLGTYYSQLTITRAKLSQKASSLHFSKVDVLRVASQFVGSNLFPGLSYVLHLFCFFDRSLRIP